MGKVISSYTTISLIRDKMTVGIGGFGGHSAPDELLLELAAHYSLHKTPRELNIVAGICPGDLTEDGFGLSALKEEGIISSIYASHVGMPPAIGRAIAMNKIAGFTVPLGVFSQLLKSVASNRPGVFTKVGLHTFCDPRLDGCRVNELAAKSGRVVVSLFDIDGTEYLHYKPFKIDLCLLRGTYSDESGNISLEHEAFYCEQASMAEAVHSCGGTVIVQVKDILENGALDPRRVQIPASIVDYVVKARAENHPQCYDGGGFRPELIGEKRISSDKIISMPLCIRKVCGRRAAFEITEGDVVNLGIGMPSSVASVVNEEGLSDKVTFSIETGVFGGISLQGVGHGAAVNPEAIIPIADNFDFYNGGGLNCAFLGLAEADEEGNVNVSKFGTRCTGPGGFIDISQNTGNICFMGTFTSGSTECSAWDGKLSITGRGGGIKFRRRVGQITFSGSHALKTGQNVLYITERCVFKLTDKGLLLVEIAPGVDLRKDILDKMEFTPIISDKLKIMDERIFRDEKMNFCFKRREY